MNTLPLSSSAAASTSSTSTPRLLEHLEAHEKVFQLSKSGRIKDLKQFLNRKPKEDRKKIVSTKYNGATSLIMACRNGHLDVVEYLVDTCQAGLEQTGLVNFEGENIEGAPPLWCASAAGHLKIVKYLVSKGANVNSTTKSNSTALRAACFDGHVEIVKYLVENNADIEIANRHGHTCLMIACYKGHYQIAKYLINKGADLNRKSVKGNTALHDCAECGSLEIMKLLLSQNAKMAPDAYRMTPLLAAAVTGHSPIVEYLLSRDECEPMEKISALELLGATFVDKKHDMLSAYNYWKTALERRNIPIVKEDGTKVLLDKKSTIQTRPIEAYDYATEFMDENELNDIKSDPDDVRMQALLIRERILGPTHPDTTYYIRYRGAVYADCGNFRKCILLWLYALDTQQKSLDPLHPMIQSSFLSFTELFQYMQKQLPNLASSSSSRETSNDSLQSSSNESTGIQMLNIYTSTVIKILNQAVEEVKRGLSLIKQYNQFKLVKKDETNSDDKLVVADEKEEKEDATTPSANGQLQNFEYGHFDRTLVVVVHFLVVVAESLKHCSPEESFKLKKLVYELIKLAPKNSKMSSLIHLASSRDSSSVIKNHTLNSFPSAQVLNLLLECGADPNVIDGDGNTALHLAALNRNITTVPSENSEGPTLSERDKIIKLLLTSGTHLDTCNLFGKTAADLYKGGKMYQSISPINFTSLQCLAAKTIKKYNIEYKEHLTPKLANFVSIH
ncbi:unnamed protein product [Brachionus calyciflorus]|uniref:Uncharacterized protein n=1 Tax=Brachionus calyciflorus TaxID=104777 RepID=A0A813TGM3_9BILA|nr:unnamed protein product [Brachionus calyciflorus]